MKQITVYPDRKLGAVKPMNCVGGGPLTSHFTYDASRWFTEANITSFRTHDIEYPFGSGEFVDIHCIFPDFEKDVNDPASYNFIFTDEYFKAGIAAGSKPFYRLGSTIEHQPIKRYIHPPKDSAKWGEICSHIISHYNEGWADGFHMGIEYWEIWNEPDIPQCWTGSWDQFFDLYNTASRVIKQAHPDVKVGGCAITSPFSPMCEPFLASVRDAGAPFDFFSWHGYCHLPEQIVSLANHAEELLEKYGFTHTESICNEWNYVSDSWTDNFDKSLAVHGTAMAGSFIAAVMCALQDTSLDQSYYYDVQMLMDEHWNGVFRKPHMGSHAAQQEVEVMKPYYALKHWGDLRRLGTQVAADGEKDLYFTAALGEGKLALLVSYYNDEKGYGFSVPYPDEIHFELPGVEYKKATAWITDEGQTDIPVELKDGTLKMNGNSIAYVVFEL